MIDRWVLQAGRGLGWLSLGVPRHRAFDALSAALALVVPLLVLTLDAQLALLAFLTIPFIALANAGRRRLVWCALALGACAASTVLASVPPATTAVRLPLVVVDVIVVLALAQAFQREARESELRRELTAEAHHRIKNSLQSVADLLYLARDEGDGGIDRAADRIRSHRHRARAARPSRRRERRGGRAAAPGRRRPRRRASRCGPSRWRCRSSGPSGSGSWPTSCSRTLRSTAARRSPSRSTAATPSG